MPFRALSIPLLCLACTLLAACGSSDPTSTSTHPGATVAQQTTTTTQPTGTEAKVGAHTITSNELNRWMTAKVGEDFYEIATHRVPAHLVSEPADYTACVASLQKVTPIPGGQPHQTQPTVHQLTHRCELLYQTVKKQTLAYLVSAYWSIDFEGARGVKVTPSEVQSALVQKESGGQGFAKMLTNNRRTLAQERFVLMNELLQQKVIQSLTAGGATAQAKFSREAEAAPASATCPTGYLVEHCLGYTPPKKKFSNSNAGAPALLLTEIARWRPETSEGFTGVPVTF
jgi:hypothetical protein